MSIKMARGWGKITLWNESNRNWSCTGLFSAAVWNNGSLPFITSHGFCTALVIVRKEAWKTGSLFTDTLRGNLSYKTRAVCFSAKLWDTYYILYLNCAYPDTISSSTMRDQDYIRTFQVCIFKHLPWSQGVVTYVLKWELKFSGVELGL